jgi:glycosyltransferase involved in cell wall biosynthesis
MSRATVLISHPFVYPTGGGNSVAAWGIQALRNEYDVTLATLGPIDYEAVNRSFGTSLKEGDFRVRIAPPHFRSLVRLSPTPGALLQLCLNMRWAQNLDRANHYDALVSTQNEADFGRLGLQYVHYPWAYMPRPDNELRWFHHVPGVLAAYRGSCQRLARTSDEGLRTSLSLANSAFVADRIRDRHGVESKILHPPVPGGFPLVPWEDRVTGIVGVGRMHGCKRWELAAAIVDRVRSQGIDLSLTLISHRDDAEYGSRLEALAAARPWFRILYDLPRDQLVREVARHRYGIHAMENEHFGIAPAEFQRAGCITFVHRSGGPMEIVGHKEELMFEDAADACLKISRAIQDAATEELLRSFVAERGACFSEDRFCAEFLEHVRLLVKQRSLTVAPAVAQNQANCA